MNHFMPHKTSTVEGSNTKGYTTNYEQIADGCSQQRPNNQD